MIDDDKLAVLVIALISAVCLASAVTSEFGLIRFGSAICFLITFFTVLIALPQIYRDDE